MTSTTKQDTSINRHLADDADCHEASTHMPGEVDQRMQKTLGKEIADLETRLASLEARLPAHSIPQAMIIEMDELEEQLIEARARLAGLRHLANRSRDSLPLTETFPHRQSPSN